MSERTTVLVVEDNPITLKMIRLTLSAEGYCVLEAQNGAAALAIFAAEQPAAVLVALTLPDAHGFEVLAKMRASPGGAELPIIALTGFLTEDDQVRAATAGFDQILVKPIEPSRLLAVVAAYARHPDAAVAPHARGKRVLLIDDDLVQRKLARLHLMRLGFEVETAVDGLDALAAARRSRPDAIVSDVLMPRLDGFQLCLAIRKDPVLSRTPVVLQSSKFTEKADRELAVKVGANAYVERDPAGTEVGKAVLASLLAAEPPVFEDVASETYSEYRNRMVHQLERQAAMNHGLLQRNIQLASALAVLGAASDAVARRQPLEDALNEIFYRCVDNAGASVGIFYVADEQRRSSLRVHSLVGLTVSARAAADSCFGYPALFELTDQREALRVPSANVPEDISRDFLAQIEVKAAVLTPVRFEDEQLGVLVLGTDTPNVMSEDWLGFAKAIGGQLGQAMALARAFEALQSSHREIEGTAEKLGRALVRAKESDRLKTVFLANMSHEVRTPLNIILGYNALIGERLTELHDETLTTCLEAVGGAGYRLLQTVQGIIDLSRLESETLEVRPALVKLTPLVENAVRQFRKAAEKKHVSLTCEIEVSDAEALVDEYCLRQSLHHLLDNAIKFTKEGGVTVRLYRDLGGAFSLAIRDTGVGIDPSYLPNLFKPFSQEDSGYNRRFEGPGIGLALVKRFLDLIGAEIVVRSEKNKGTTVTIHLAPSVGSVAAVASLESVQ